MLVILFRSLLCMAYYKRLLYKTQTRKCVKKYNT